MEEVHELFFLNISTYRLADIINLGEKMRWTIFHRRLFSPAYVFMLRYGLIRLDCKKMYFFIMFIVSKSDCPSRFDRVDDL